MKEIKTYSVRLFPNKQQKQQIEHLSVVRNMIFNALLDIEFNEYQTNKKIFSEFDLNYKLPELKSKYIEFKMLNSKACQRISKEVFSSYKSFFSLVKKDHTARPPRKIEDVQQFHTIVFNQSGWKFKEHMVNINGIDVEYKGKEGVDFTVLKAKEVRLKKVNGKYLLDFCVENLIPQEEVITVRNKVLAIDLGIKNLANGVDNDGNWVTLPNKTKKINQYFRTQISEVQSKMDKCVKDSNKHKKLRAVKKKLYNRKNAQIKQTLHIQSKKIANMNYKTIVVGELSVKKLMGTTDNKIRKISRSFGETNAAMFLEYLKYKCQSKNTDVETISERWTTQQNCLTGKLFKDKIELSDRTVKLSDSIEIDRDLNAAINILKRYEQNHLALVTEPLNVFNVVNKYNLLTKPSSQ